MASLQVAFMPAFRLSLVLSPAKEKDCVNAAHVSMTMCNTIARISSKLHFLARLHAMARLVIDVRERALINLFNDRAEGHHIEALAVGDIQCEYASGQRGWVVERKSACDLAASLCDSRYQEQRSRMLECNLRPIYIIEGDLRQTPLYRNIMPAIVNLQLRGVDVFRTFDIEETFCLLVLFVEKLESPPLRGITAMESGIKPPRSKRERERHRRERRFRGCCDVSLEYLKMLQTAWRTISKLCQLCSVLLGQTHRSPRYNSGAASV